MTTATDTFESTAINLDLVADNQDEQECRHSSCSSQALWKVENTHNKHTFADPFLCTLHADLWRPFINTSMTCDPCKVFLKILNVTPIGK